MGEKGVYTYDYWRPLLPPDANNRTTFLNLMRGSGINGFLNMREVEEHHLLPNGCKICRPLLNISKKEILNICNEV